MTCPHTITITAEEGLLRAGDFVCDAPPDALCHAVWSCDCETYHSEGIRNGVPAHQPGWCDDDTTWHAGRFEPGFCNYRDWFDGMDETLDGSAVIPVTPRWEGEEYAFVMGGDA